MKILIQKHKEHPYFIKALKWIKLISMVGSARLIIQAVGLISGIMVVRLLPDNEMALYTLVNTMLGTLMMLTDSGISTGVMSEGGKVWQDREKLGTVIVTGLDLRKKFAIAALCVVAPVLMYLLIYNGASWLMSFFLLLSLIPAFLTSLSSAMLSVPPKLHQDLMPLQKNQVYSNVARLFLTAITIFTFPFAYIAILASGIPQIWANFKLRKISDGYADWSQKADPEVRGKILAIVWKTLPGVAYYCVYSQINIWICSMMGSPKVVAQLGALSRLVVMLGIFYEIFSTLVTPRYSRLEEKASLLFKRFIQISLLVFSISAFVAGVVWLFPSEVLWILGNKYSNLTFEIFLNVIGALLAFIAGSYVTLYSSRGWVLNPVISIGVSILSIASGAAMIDLSTLKGIYYYDIYLVTIQVLMYLIYILYKLNQMRKRERRSVIL